MAFDYKKEYKEYYLPPKQPQIICIPAMNFIAVQGKGNPNHPNGSYQESIGLLYGVAYTIKMSKLGQHKIEGYFDYVVPPLEGFWWQEGICGVDYEHKEKFEWISLIRLPEFVTKKEFDWAVKQATEKKQQDFSKVQFMTYEEGLCVQCMHQGPYDEEPATVQMMAQVAAEQGYIPDFESGRYHHEIYLSDVRRCKPENLKTVIRQPIKKAK
ncbi:MAG: GyrI-like domain-containing protein [Massiliimalia sp.]|jgi:hypothetical protein